MLLQEENRHLQTTHLASPERLIIYYFAPLTTWNQLAISSFHILKQLILLVDFLTWVIQVIIYQLVLNLKSSRDKYSIASAIWAQFFMFHIKPFVNLEIRCTRARIWVKCTMSIIMFMILMTRRQNVTKEKLA